MKGQRIYQGLVADASLSEVWRRALGDARLERSISRTEQADPPELAKREAGSWTKSLWKRISAALAPSRQRVFASHPDWVTISEVGYSYTYYPYRAPERLVAGGDWIPAYEATLRQELGVSGRLALNRYFLTEPGMARLRAALAQNTYRLNTPEEGAHLAMLALMDSGQAQAAVRVLQEIAPYFATLRFFPEPVAETAPPLPETVSVWCVGQLRAFLHRHEPPARIARQREALTRWSPVYEGLLQLVRETCHHGYPFEVYPEGWAERVRDAAENFQAQLSLPSRHRSPRNPSSRLHRLLDVLQLAARFPHALDTRDRNWARALLSNSEARWGALGSPEREQKLHSRHEVLKGQQEIDAAILDLLAATGAANPRYGMETPPSPEGLPQTLARRVRRIRRASLSELVRAGNISSVEVLAEMVEVLELSLFRDCYAPEVWKLMCSLFDVCRRLQTSWHYPLREPHARFRNLPWVKPFPETAAESFAELARHMLALIWEAFPHVMLSSTACHLLNRLLARSGRDLVLGEVVAINGRQRCVDEKFLQLANLTVEASRDTLYSRYYPLPRGPFHDPKDFGATCILLARLRGESEDRIIGQEMIIEEQQILTSANLWPLYQELRPQVDPASATQEILTFLGREMRLPKQTPRQRRKRRRRIGQAWRQMVFFLSLCPFEQASALLTEAHGSLDRDFAPYLEALRKALEGDWDEGPILYAWTADDPQPVLVLP